MAYEIDSKAGLIGYYEGTLKITLEYLESIPQKKRSHEAEMSIERIKRSLERGDEIWQKVKGRE